MPPSVYRHRYDGSKCDDRLARPQNPFLGGFALYCACRVSSSVMNDRVKMLTIDAPNLLGLPHDIIIF